jgi:copper chaperone CopZ
LKLNNQKGITTMKILTILLTAITLSSTMPAFADHTGDDHSSHTEVEKTVKEVIAVQSGDVHISVNGLVCEFCARALEKLFGNKEEVKAIDVNLNDKVITINFNEGQTLDDEIITQLITDSGYNVETIHRVE